MRPISLIQTGVGVSVPIPMDWRADPFSATLDALVSGAAPTYTIQYTCDDIRTPGWNPATANWESVAGMTAVANAPSTANLVSPVTAVRINQTAGAGSTTLRVLQAGF